VSQAQAYATLNYRDYGTIVAAEVVVLGNWDGAGTFTAGGSPIIATADVNAFATAVAGSQRAYTRFLIDEDLLDSDLPVIEELAEEYDMGSEEIISDNDGDWFIDLAAR